MMFLTTIHCSATVPIRVTEVIESGGFSDDPWEVGRDGGADMRKGWGLSIINGEKYMATSPRPNVWHCKSRAIIILDGLRYNRNTENSKCKQS